MTTHESEPSYEMKRVLWACQYYWASEPLTPEKRLVCYTWVLKPFRSRFGTAFHQSRLEHLARLGFLQKLDTSRGGKRRYYRISNPNHLSDLLAKWALN